MGIIIGLPGYTDIAVIKLIGDTSFECLFKNVSSSASFNAETGTGCFSTV